MTFTFPGIIVLLAGVLATWEMFFFQPLAPPPAPTPSDTEAAPPPETSEPAEPGDPAGTPVAETPEPAQPVEPIEPPDPVVEPAVLPRLEVSEDGRYLIRTDTQAPFFWLADSAWYLSDLSPDEIDHYMQDRAAKGFTVIQGPIIIRKQFDTPGLIPNYSGDMPFIAAGNTLLNEEFLAYLDLIIDKAMEHGLYIVPAVIWGPTLDQIVSVQTPDVARAIGQQLGQRYSDRPNVLWIVSGEYHKIAWESEPRDRTELTSQELGLIDALAQGLEIGHGGLNLMTVHPDAGKSSSEHFHNADWLDFNMIQTYTINAAADDIVQSDWDRNPAKPTLNAEPAYENRNLDAPHDPITPWKVRYEAYHAVLQGAMGHTYGHWDIWQAANAWASALDSPGALSMRHLRALIESRPAAGREPYQQMLLDDAGDYDSLQKVRATRNDSENYAMIYFPDSNIRARILLSEIPGETLNAWWFNPQDGRIYNEQGQLTGQPFAVLSQTHNTTMIFDPPGSLPEQDWVLILDDASRNFLPPGTPSPG